MTASTEEQSAQGPTYTEEQARLCTEVLSKSNYYRILGVSKDAEEEEIKKAYRKFAIKLHPDKNKAPQSSEAFKKVSAAYACLTDPKKREFYDLTGQEPGNSQSAEEPKKKRKGKKKFEQD